MFKQIFLNFNDAHLMVLGFLLFMGTFLGALIWTLLVQKKSFYDELSRMPLQPLKSSQVLNGESVSHGGDYGK